MARYKVEIVNVNTADIKVLKNDEMIKLFKELRKGNLACKEKLINGNLKLVLSILKKYNNRTDNMDDLFQVGCVGLIKAIDNFDLSHEVKFSTYAVPMILGEIKRYLRDSSSLRVARSIKDLAYQALKKKEELTNKYNREISISELSKEMNIPEYEIANAFEAMYDTVSIFEPIFNDGGDTIYLCDQLSLRKEEYDKDLKLALEKAMEKLKPRELQVLRDRFLIGKTQMEIASELDISQAQISRIEKSAITNIKKLIK